MIHQVISVSLGDRSYSILIGDEILNNFGDRLKEKFKNSKAAIITNQNVFKLYGEIITESLELAGITYKVIYIPDSESAKSLSIAEQVYAELIEGDFERKDVIVALGGGVVGDLAGFVAATYQRGVPFIQVPTTLLAQVDSSVGGKVAVNHPLAKNMIGAFYQPSFVYTDVSTLKSLPEREFACGMAEVIKYAFIKSNNLLSKLQNSQTNILERNADIMSEIVADCCIIKADIVEKDELDQGIRAFLNYGHTLGHAIESTTNYKYSHGEAISIGMVFAAHLAHRLGLIDESIVELHKKIISKYNLPIRAEHVNLKEIIRSMEHDKKRSMGGHVFVLLDGIGNPKIVNVEDKILLEELEAFLGKG